jgi:hypothetical protein
MAYSGYSVTAIWCGTNFMIEANIGSFSHEAEAYAQAYNNRLSLLYSELDSVLCLMDGDDGIKELKDEDIAVKHLPEHKHTCLEALEDDFEPVFISIDEFASYSELFNVHEMDRMGERFGKIIRFNDGCRDFPENFKDVGIRNKF